MLLVGYQHQKGHSQKTDRDYDFYTLHALTKSQRCDGFMTYTLNVSPEVFLDSEISVGSLFIAERDGFQTGIRVTGHVDLPSFVVR